MAVSDLLQRRSWLSTTAITLSLLAGLAGCGTAARNDTYDLSASVTGSGPAARGRQILVQQPTALRAIDSEQIVIRVAPSQIQYLSKAQWGDKLPRMVQAKLVEAYENSGKLGGVGVPGQGLAIDYQLVTDIRAFEIDTTGGSHAVVEISAKIVNDLLDFSRINPAQRRTTTVKSIALAQLDRLAPLERVRVEQEFPDSLPSVLVDPVHAGQVVMNLLTNAVQAMGDQGGTLILRARLNGGDVVMLEITDSGPGVPPENLERIFEPLFTTKARGIGLGLAVSKSLAQANGGDLAVRSEPGRGATFIFAMPAEPGPA